MAVVVEILNHHRRVVHRYFFQHFSISFGRAFDNDVILDDIHADANHCMVEWDRDATLVMKDLGSVNGVRDAKGKALSSDSLVFKGVHEFTIGKTLIRVSDAKAPVPQAVRLHEDNLLQKWLNHPVSAVVGLAVLALFAIYDVFVGQVKEVELATYVQAAAWYVIGALLIALSLSFVGKVFRREWRLPFIMAFLALIGVLNLTGSFALEVIAFNYYLLPKQWLIDAVWTALVIYILVFGLSRVLFNFKPWLERAVAGGVVVVLLGLTSLEHLYSDLPKYVHQPPTTPLYLADRFTWRTPVTDEEFLKQSQSVFDIPVEESETQSKDALNSEDEI